MSALNLISVVTGILYSIAIVVSTVIGLVPRFRHKAIRATVKAIDRHRAAMKAENAQIETHDEDDWFQHHYGSKPE